MPWTSADVENFKKGLSRKQRKKWASIANGALASCMEGGGSDKDCAGRAVRIANSRFGEAFNPVIKGDLRMDDVDCEWVTINGAHICIGGGGDDDGGDDEPEIRERAKKILGKITLKDPLTGNLPSKERLAALGKDARKAAKREIAERRRIEKMRKNTDGFSDLGECEMEIFRCGTHNGDEYTEEHLKEIASNFEKLKDEVRPKLKITHREKQESLAGLASYGDVVSVFVKAKRLFAKVANVPKQVLEWIKDRRFPERSIEIYPEFKLGTDEKSPLYRNVLKAVALLGSEMPAVTGMAPVKLEECLECQGTVCFREGTDEKVFVSKEAELNCKILEEMLKV